MEKCFHLSKKLKHVIFGEKDFCRKPYSSRQVVVLIVPGKNMARI
jgi:hypothetical protein